MFSVACLILLVAVGAQFTCNKIKIKDQCDGMVASDGVCVWQGIYCSAGAPAPSPTVVSVTAPELVCPPSAAEAACIYNPCRVGEICYSNTDAVCVVNTCVGVVEYLGTFLTEPCSAVYVDTVAQQVVACNVREVIRPAIVPEEGTVEDTAATVAAASSPAPAASQTVSSSLLGLPPLTVDEPAASAPPVSSTSTGLSALDVFGFAVEDEEEAEGETPLLEPTN